MSRLEIRRRLLTKRAPRKRDGYGGSYTPSGIDIYTVDDDPTLVSFQKFGRDQRVRIADLLAILDELDKYERRARLAGEDIEIQLELVAAEADKGDVLHFPGHLTATPDKEHTGLVALHIPGRDLLGGHTLTAERASLREALENLPKLEALEQADAERYPKDSA